jgi:uncharacterized membrane protein YciS (DUF1049 family)
MRIIKIIILFTIAFLMAWILIFTFMQPPFRALVPAKILAYQTPSIPIYYYVTGAFAAGLFMGLLLAIYYFISLKTELVKRNRKIAGLEAELRNAGFTNSNQEESGPQLHPDENPAAPYNSTNPDPPPLEP